MSKTVEKIKAMSKEAAVQRALKRNDATADDIVSIVELKKSKSFLGLFSTEGEYEITIDKNRNNPDEAKKMDDLEARLEARKNAEKEAAEKAVKVEKVEVKVEKPKAPSIPKEEKVQPPKKKEIEKTEIKDFVKEVKVEKKPKEATKKVEQPKKVEKNEVKEVKEIKEVKTEKKESKHDKEPQNEMILLKTRTLLNNMNLKLDAEITSREGKYYVVNLFGEDNGIIIGKKGKTLNSFEYLLNSICKDCRIEVDVEGFKEKRNDTLRELGRKMAEKAISTNKVVKLNPMPPRERKIIHEVINTFKELDTFSEGKDPKRYIVIKKKK